MPSIAVSTRKRSSCFDRSMPAERLLTDSASLWLTLQREKRLGLQTTTASSFTVTSLHLMVIDAVTSVSVWMWATVSGSNTDFISAKITTSLHSISAPLPIGQYN